MNYRAISAYLGRVLKAEAVFMLIPLGISLYENELAAVRAFLAAICIMIAIGLATDFIGRSEKNIYTKDGFVLVAVCWVAMSLFGALPYRLSGQIPSFVDSLFESVSGFTTTGATVLADIEALSKGLLFWRCFSQWIGGMGVLVFLLAIVQSASDERSLHVMKAEAPGPSPGKLVPKLRQSSRVLYGIYCAMTLIQVILLCAGGMPLFDSVLHAFTTAGTGGFSLWNSSIAHYNSVYIEIVVTVFMILFGVNFNIYYFLLIRNFRAILKSDELKAYFGIIVAAIAVVTIDLTGSAYDTVAASLRHASFQVAAAVTSTGYATADFNFWPQASKTVLMLLIFIGACAGSTGCGIKVSRIVIMLRETRRVMFRISHPRSVEVVKMDGKAVDKTIVHGVSNYLVTFFVIFGVSLLLLSFNGFDFESTFTALAACINNFGPAFGIAGPSGNYSVFSGFSKVVLSINMLIGRLEIYPILLLFAPRTWGKM